MDVDVAIVESCTEPANSLAAPKRVVMVGHQVGLTTEPPADEVQDVGPDVQQHPFAAALSAEVRPRHDGPTEGLPVREVDSPDPPDCPFCQHRCNASIAREETPGVIHRRHNPFLFRSRYKLPNLVWILGKRLFTEHMDSAGQATHGKDEMKVMRNGQDRRVNPAQNVVEV